MNAECQPQVNASQGTIAGAIIAPTLAPELKIVVASVRSFLGNQSATALIADGKLPPSPRPERGARHVEAADAADQRVRPGGQAPGGDRGRVADLGAEAIDELAEQQAADRVRGLEHRVRAPELLVGPVQLVVEDRLDQRQDLPVDVVDRRREEQQRADHPAVVTDCAFTRFVVHGIASSKRAARRTANVHTIDFVGRAPASAREPMLLLLVICGGMLSVCLGGCQGQHRVPVSTDIHRCGDGWYREDSATRAVEPAAASPVQRTLVGYATLDGGTTGGGDGPMYTADTLAQLRTYAGMTGPADHSHQRNDRSPDSPDAAANRSSSRRTRRSIPVHAGDGLVYGGLRIKEAHNVIVRNLTIAKALESGADAITIQTANNVWVDHCDLSSDLTSPKETYDGLVDIIHGSHERHGLLDPLSRPLRPRRELGRTHRHSNRGRRSEDLALAVTFHHNLYSHVVEGAPRARFGHVHLFNNYYDTVQMPSDPTTATYAIASTDGATLLHREQRLRPGHQSRSSPFSTNASVTDWHDQRRQQCLRSGLQPVGQRHHDARNNWKPPYQYVGSRRSPDDVRAIVGTCAGPGKVP